MIQDTFYYLGERMGDIFSYGGIVTIHGKVVNRDPLCKKLQQSLAENIIYSLEYCELVDEYLKNGRKFN